MDILDFDVPVPHDDGSMISEKISRIVELIREYDENLDVRWIHPSKRALGDAAFAIIEKTRHGKEVVAFYVQSEDEFDERVLERIYKADAAKHGHILNQVDAANAAVRAVQQKKAQEQLEEAADLSYHILRSPKARYRHNGIVYE
jgi:GTPase Era involved in 16S rRNA processing